MVPDDATGAPAPTRAELGRRRAHAQRAQRPADQRGAAGAAGTGPGAGGTATLEADELFDSALTSTAEATDAPSPRRTRIAPRALTWVTPAAVTTPTAAWPERVTIENVPPLVTRWPKRAPARAAVLVPLLTALALATAYVVAMLAWPLNAVTPTVTTLPVQGAAAPAAEMPWPAEGAASVSVSGVGAATASTTDALTMASITKVVSSLVILEEMPLAPGEQGPSFSFPRQTVWDYLNSDESALPVPVGGSLTQFELLAGTLIGSAGNYIDRLAAELYPNDAVYARAANDWLRRHGIEGITIADPSGIGRGNTATPASLLALGRVAMANPVIAEIVAMQSIELPGAGLVENTNRLLAEPGFVGVKTGMLDRRYNILLAKDVAVGDTTLRLYASVLHQDSPETRTAVAQSLFAAAEAQLQPTVVVPARTVVGTADTVWGAEADIVTADDASVILFNGATATGHASVSLPEDWTADNPAGAVTVTGPADSVTVEARFAEELEGPSAWWRLTHPLELLGLR